MSDKGIFSKLIGDARKNARLSQRAFGALFDPPVTQQSVAGWEHGTTTPDRQYWSRLAEILEMEVGRFYEFIGTQTTDKTSLVEDIAVKIKSLGADELKVINDLVAQQWVIVDNFKQAADPSHIRILQKGAEKWNEWREKNPEIQPNLKEVNLAAIGCTDLSYYNLDYADLTNIKGYRTNFYQVSALYTNWNGAILQNVNFQNAMLHGCNLSNAKIEDSHFIEAILDSSNLTGAVLSDINFSKASLIKANLSDIKLNFSDLTQANLMQAIVTNAVISNCNFASTYLWEVDLSSIKESYNINVSTRDTNYIPKDNLAWALFCTLRQQQAEMFAPKALTMLLEQEQQVIKVATILAEKYGAESQSEKSYLYVKQHNFTFYHISRKDDFLEVTATNPDRNAIIIRVNNGFIDSNIRQADVDNLEALLNKEEGSGNKATNKTTKKPS
jgi:uncharacterized protein YjbI with pentapeptide repeats